MEHVTGEAGTPLATAAAQTTGNASAASAAASLAPVAAAAGIAWTAQDATTATSPAALTCARGFWLANRFDSGGVLWYGPASGTAPTSAGANATGAIVPGDRKWFGLASPSLLKIIASATTTYYAVDAE